MTIMPPTTTDMTRRRSRPALLILAILMLLGDLTVTPGATTAVLAQTPASVDLELEKTADAPDPVHVGDEFNYTISVTNQGPDTAPAVTVLDPLPEQVTFVSASGDGAYLPATGIWTVGNIAASETAEMVITVEVNENDEFTNTAEVFSVDGVDIDSTPNNQIPSEDDQDSVTVTGYADTDVDKVGVDATSLSDVETAVGSQVDWTVTYTQEPGFSNGEPASVVVTDAIPVNTEYMTGSLSVPDGWTAEWSTDGGVTWTASEPGSGVTHVRMTHGGFGQNLSVSKPISAPLQGQLSTNAGGDGFSPIKVTMPDGEKRIIIIFHQAIVPRYDAGYRQGDMGRDIRCFIEETGADCPEIPGGAWMSSQPGPLNTGPNDMGSEWTPAYVVDEEFYGQILYPASKRVANDNVEHGVGCVNYLTFENCGFWPLIVDLNLNAPVNTHNVVGYELIDGNMWGMSATTGEMLCFNVASKTPCAGQPYPFPPNNPRAAGRVTMEGDLDTNMVGVVANGTRLYYASKKTVLNPTSTNHRSPLVLCWDTVTAAPCAGYTPSEIASWLGGRRKWNSADVGLVFLEYDANSNPIGVCSNVYIQEQSGLTILPTNHHRWSGGCFDLDTGARKYEVPPWAGPGWHAISPIYADLLLPEGNQRLYSVVTLNAYDRHSPIDNTHRTYIPYNGNVNTGSAMLCIDWTNQELCSDVSDPGAPGLTAGGTRFTSVSGGRTWTYGFGGDDTGCLYGLGHVGILWSFDEKTAEVPCKRLDVKTSPASAGGFPECPAPGLDSWTTIRVTGFDNDDVTNARVTLINANGDPVPGFEDVPLTFTSGVATVDISSVPVTAPTHQMHVLFEGEFVNSDPFTSANPPEVHLDALIDNAAMCFSTTVTNDCAQASQMLTNTVTSATSATESHSSTDSASLVIGKGPDCESTLDITKTNGRDTLGTGETFDYTITVNNLGPAIATGVVVTDPIGSGLDWDGTTHTTTHGTCIDGAVNPGVDPPILECDIGNLDVADPVTITIPVTVTAPSGSTVTNTAEVCHDEYVGSECVDATDTDPVRSSIGGIVFMDSDSDGLYDEATEPGLSGIGVTVYAAGPDGIFGTGDDVAVASTVTDGDGNYVFYDLPDNEQFVVEVDPSGGTFTIQGVGDPTPPSPNSDVNPATGRTNPIVTVPGSGIIDGQSDAGMQVPVTDVTGTVFADVDESGTQNLGPNPGDDFGVGEVTVQLIDAGSDGIFGTADDEVFASVTTDGDGNYVIPNIPIGQEYQIRVIPPGDAQFTDQNVGGDDTIDSDVDDTGRSAPFVVTPSTVIDAGLVRNFNPNPDAVISPQGVPVTFNVLDNDELDEYTPGDILPDDTYITRATSPVWGPVSCDAKTGECVWTPPEHYVGSTTFTYVLHTPTWGEHAMTVALESLYVNDAPVIRPDMARTGFENPITFNVLDNDEDPNDPSSSWEPVSPNRPGDPLTATWFGALSNPAAGTVSCATDGECTFEPADGFVGAVTFDYTAQDTGVSDLLVEAPGVPGGYSAVQPLSATATVFLFVDPDPNIKPTFTGSDHSLSVTETGTFSDVTDAPVVVADCVGGAPRVSVAWNETSDGRRYRIERTATADPSAGWVHVGTVAGPGPYTYIDDAVSEDTDYRYRIVPERYRWVGAISPVSDLVSVFKPDDNAHGCNPGMFP